MNVRVLAIGLLLSCMDLQGSGPEGLKYASVYIQDCNESEETPVERFSRIQHEKQESKQAEELRTWIDAYQNHLNYRERLIKRFPELIIELENVKNKTREEQLAVLRSIAFARRGSITLYLAGPERNKDGQYPDCVCIDITKANSDNNRYYMNDQIATQRCCCAKKITQNESIYCCLPARPSAARVLGYVNDMQKNIQDGIIKLEQLNDTWKKYGVGNGYLPSEESATRPAPVVAVARVQVLGNPIIAQYIEDRS